jgi:asparagine synthase (glutamine-hydrolysing)
MVACDLAGHPVAGHPGAGLGPRLDVRPGVVLSDAGQRVERMIGRQRHRGPDGKGIFRDREAVLGHCRLAIVGLGDAGRQPMTSRDGRWTISFNGEVFNYPEIRNLLGGTFRTGTDTEVLLEAIAAWGVEPALDRVAGMFAFALWDGRERELTLARDRLGEKPLVYFWDGKILAFASEIKALESLHQSQLDAAAVDAYLGLGYVPAPLAIFRNCRKLEAGHILRFRLGAVPRVTRWWFPENAARERPGSQSGRHAALREHMATAVGQRLRADVPIALSLSGGVDSSVIAAECVRQGSQPEAFTVRFASEGTDNEETDLVYARQVARHLGLRHHVLDASGSQAAGEMETLVRHAIGHYDEPFADSSALPSLSLARAVAGHYKVIFDGDGGDEAFGGYKHYQHIAAKQAVKAVAAAAGFCDGSGTGASGVYIQSKVTFRAAQRARFLNGYGSGKSLRQLLEERWYRTPPGNALQRALATDRYLPLANGLTYKMDIALGAFGIEGRAPFLDHRLIEWAQWLPNRDLVQGREKKILLRAAYAAKLPAGALDRPKQGFGAPIARWLTGPLRDMVRDSLPCPLLERTTPADWTGQRLWTLLMFSAWARHWRASW